MRLDAVQIISFFVGCTLYGIVLSTIIPCTRSLLFNLRPSSDSSYRIYSLKHKREIKFPILITAWLAFIIATVDNVIWVPEMLDAFVYGPSGGAIEYFQQLSRWAGSISLIDEALAISIGDAVLIYRCYIIYDRAWEIVILSGVLFLASAACAGLAASKASTRTSSGSSISEASISPFITATLALTVATNTITTGLIVYRLWRTECRSSPYRLSSSSNINAASPQTIHRAIKLVVESGSVYTTLACVTLILHVLDNNFQYTAAVALVQLVPINFNLIVIRAERSRPAPCFDYEMQASVLPSSGTHQLRNSASAQSSRSQATVAPGVSSETVDTTCKSALEMD